MLKEIVEGISRNYKYTSIANDFFNSIKRKRDNQGW